MLAQHVLSYLLIKAPWTSPLRAGHTYICGCRVYRRPPPLFQVIFSNAPSPFWRIKWEGPHLAFLSKILNPFKIEPFLQYLLDKAIIQYQLYDFSVERKKWKVNFIRSKLDRVWIRVIFLGRIRMRFSSRDGSGLFSKFGSWILKIFSDQNALDAFTFYVKHCMIYLVFFLLIFPKSVE